MMSLRSIIVVPAIGEQDYDLVDLIDKLYSRFLACTPAIARVLFFRYQALPIHTKEDVFETHAAHLLECLQREWGQQEKRPIHFVGYSTGGLIVKKTVILAHQTPKFARLASSCFSIAFFGTPRRYTSCAAPPVRRFEVLHIRINTILDKGSSILSESFFAASVQQQLRLKEEMPSTIRDVVVPENHAIRLLAYDFLPLSRKMQKIWTFIENIDSVLTANAKSDDNAASLSKIRLEIPVRSVFISHTMTPAQCTYPQYCCLSRILSEACVGSDVFEA